MQSAKGFIVGSNVATLIYKITEPNKLKFIEYNSYRFVFFSEGLKTNQIWLVFTSDGVVVGVGIRSEEQYDLVKIKPMRWEEDH